MTDREELIEKALREHPVEATGLGEIACRCDHEWRSWGSYWAHQAKAVADALAVFEAAQEPTTDEREALATLVDSERRGWTRMGSGDSYDLADAILADRRPVQAEPSECSNPDCPLKRAHSGPCAPKGWQAEPTADEREALADDLARRLIADPSYLGLAEGTGALHVALSDSIRAVIEDVYADCGDSAPGVLSSNIGHRLAWDLPLAILASRCPVQAEPTDAQVEAALEAAIDATEHRDDGITFTAMRAALSAAFATNQEENR